MMNFRTLLSQLFSFLFLNAWSLSSHVLIVVADGVGKALPEPVRARAQIQDIKARKRL